MASSASQSVLSSTISTMSSSQPISLVGTMGLLQNASHQIPQNMSILQNQLTPQQIAALQVQQAASSQHLSGARPVVNVVGNQQTVATLQNVQVLATARQEGIGNVPINIITTGGQTYAVASNLQSGAQRAGVPTQMQIRSIAPNAAAVVNQIQSSQLTAQQIRNSVQQQQQHQQQQQQQQQLQLQQQQQRLQNSITPTPNGHLSAQIGKPVQQVNLTLPLQGGTQPVSVASAATSNHNQVLTKRKLQDLLNEIDPAETMDDDVEEALLQIADDFIENVINSSCQIAKHRKSNTLEVKDVQLHLDRNWNMWIPGFGSDDLRPYKRLPSTEAHRQRLALIKKAMKK